MSITTIFVLILIGVAAVAGFIAWAMAKATKQAKRDLAEVKKLADSYVKQLTNQQAELDRRQNIIKAIERANHEATEQRDKISAPADPADRFDASIGVLSDIASRSGTKAGQR